MRVAVVALGLLLSTVSLPAGPQNLTGDRGPLEQAAQPITSENSIPPRILEVVPIYPPEAVAIGATGRVTVRVTVDEFGRVAEVRRPASPPLIFPAEPATVAQLAAATEALLTATAHALGQWQYEPPATPPIAFNVTIGYTPSAEPSLMGQDGSESAARDRTPVPFIPPPTLVDSDPAWADGAIRVGGDVRMPRRVRNVNPLYPAEARDRRVQGMVIIEARIGEDGHVTKTRVLRGVAGLDEAALDAVGQWEFEPVLLNGQPIPVVTTVVVSFSL